MKRLILPSILILSMLLTACGTSTATAEATDTPVLTTPTPDLCSAANLPAEVTLVNKLMREFDDYSSLASHTAQAQLIAIIPDMQRILREAEDMQVPPCLQTLKKLQLSHMNLVVQVLMAFMNSKSSDAQAINDGIAKARDLHSKYDLEIARLLGLTLVPRPTGTPGGAATNANVPPPATALVVFVTNPGPTGINLRSSAALNAPEAGALASQISTGALGRSADSQWIKVEVPGQPGQTAWVFASLVQLSVPIDQLPVTE